MFQPTKTIVNSRAAGETRTVYCERMGCGHRAQMRFDELRLPDDLHSHSSAAQFPLLEMRKPGREGNADLSAGTRTARPPRLTPSAHRRFGGAKCVVGWLSTRAPSNTDRC